MADVKKSDLWEEEVQSDPQAFAVKNLELLDYLALKMNEIYNFKEFSTYFPAMEKHFLNVQKWTLLRNFFVILLWAILIFSKPDWCDRLGMAIDSECWAAGEKPVYYTITGYYLSNSGFEIASWCLILVLILYDLLLVDVSARMLVVFCVLFVLDIFLGFLFLDGFVITKYNTLIRFLFLILYTRTSRFFALELVLFYYRAKKLYFLYLTMVLFLGMLLNVLYFDVDEEVTDLFYSKLDFSNVLTSFYSSYTIMTFQNTLALFSFTLKRNPIFVLFLLPIYFLVLFLLLPFIISILTYIYIVTVRSSILRLENFSNFKKVFFYFKNERGISSYNGLKNFINDFFKDPKKIDFSQFEQVEKKTKTDEKTARQKLATAEYNSRHHKDFLTYQTNIFYKIALVVVDSLIAISPIYIININDTSISNVSYVTISILATLSMINPMLSLLFNSHKISIDRKKVYGFSILMSIFIIITAVILPLRGSDPGKTLEMSNDLLFIFFALLCFTKLVTVYDELWLKNDLIYNIFLLSQEVVPFLFKILVVVISLNIFYAFLGRMLFGGLINSQSVADYKTKTGIDLRSNYEYFNFNDFLNSFLTLTVLIIQNNWVYVLEHFYSVRPYFTTTLFFVSFNLMVVFTFIALFLGVVSKMIIVYFEIEFNDLGMKKKLEQNKEILSDSDEDRADDEKPIG